MEQAWLESVPSRPEQDPVAWGERHVRLPGSARSQRYDSAISPWGREPLRALCGGTRVVTFVKPVQAGGSTVGEVALCYWLATSSSGDTQYNWEDDLKARDRWDKRIERILLECKPVMRRAPPLDRTSGKWAKGKVLFPHANLTVQGVWQPDNLDSDTVRFQINEELHNWEPGRLVKAYNRTSAVWNACILNVSNAGLHGGQLHEAFLSGTQEHWETKCPGCGEWHVLRTQWDPKRPELGGLRYDADGCRLEGGRYDYQRLAPTVRYQMPCGHEVRDDPVARRRMSLEGRYGKPANPGALGERSFTLEAVSVDYIPWLQLIKDKHAALRALKFGDPAQWWRYLQERECRFVDVSEDRPVVGAVQVRAGVRKSREGLADRVVRFAALDRQQGSLAKGEFPHWWGVVRDVARNGDSLLVWEGKLLTDEDAVDMLKRHGVSPACVVVDSGDDTTHVYLFCLRNGYNAIKGSSEETFAHPSMNGRRIFSPEKPLHAMVGAPPSFPTEPAKEPLFWFYSKPGIRERLHWWRGADGSKWQVPEDVSDDYKRHMEAEVLQERKVKKTGEIVREWVQVKKRNDLFVCECYIAMLVDMGGLMGGNISS